MSTIYDTLDASTLRKPGAFSLTDINLVSYSSAKGDTEPKRISIETMVIDLNIYESIFNKCLSGNLLVVDTNNVVGNMPLTGYERLEFKFFTPSSSKGYDFSVKSGNPMYVYKISKRQAVNPRTQMYILHFCSKELMTNEEVKVQNAQTDTYTNMVANIVSNPDFLNSAKNVYIEPSKGLHKEVFGNDRPLDAIEHLSLKTISSKYSNSGYHFYETSDGFFYRSLESMLAVESNTARPVLAKFRPKPANIRDGGNKDIKNEMQIAIKFKIVDQFDTLKNLRNGVYASKLITHDATYKQFTVRDFDYNTEYEQSMHTEPGKDGIKTDNTGILPLFNKEGKFLSSQYNTSRMFASSTQKIHDNTELPNPRDYLQKRLSQRLAFTSFKLEITVPGFTGLTAGDLITFEMPSFQPYGEGNPRDNDPYMSGRYLITSIRHQLNRKQNKHIMILECMKDSVRKPYPEENVDTFTGKEKERRGIINIYELDKNTLNALNNFF
jgi:hypothetical protein